MKPEEMLAFYSARLPTVEINNTFYRMPKTSVLENWAATTPDDFRFAIKASRRITHMCADQGRIGGRAARLSLPEPRGARRQARPGAVPAAAEPEEGPAAPRRFLAPAARGPPRRVRISQRDLVRRRRLRRAQGRRRGAVPVRARGQRAAAAGRDRAVGLRAAAPRDVLRRRSASSGRERLEATSWREILVYFMHEPTAPAYAQTLMQFASCGEHAATRGRRASR